MSRSVTVSAPGKVILMGEHSAVYGRPAVTAALGARLVVHLEPLPGSNEGGSIHLDLPQLAHQEETSWQAVRRLADAARSAWERWAADPTPEGFRALQGREPGHLVKIALGEAAAAFGLSRSCRLEVTSEIPVGSGFGSSAALAAALLGACQALRSQDPGGGPERDGSKNLDLRRLQGLGVEVERRQHGTPSGIDTATVLHGGLLWAERPPGGELAVSPFPAHPKQLRSLFIFHSGQPPEGTGAVVSQVRRRLTELPGGGEPLLDEMAAATAAFRRHLAASPEETGAGVVEAMGVFHRGLVRLGVVPEEVQELVARVEEKGGAAKISGAGSLAGPGAGSLLVYHPGTETPFSWPFLSPLPHVSAPLGDAGTRIEAAP